MSREAPGLHCCPPGRRLIQLRVPFLALEAVQEFHSEADFLDWLRARPPTWHVIIREPRLIDGEWSWLKGDTRHVNQVEVGFCPWCGTPTPDVIWNLSFPNPTALPLDLDHCARCEQHNRECRCWPIERYWRVK